MKFLSEIGKEKENFFSKTKSYDFFSFIFIFKKKLYQN